LLVCFVSSSAYNVCACIGVDLFSDSLGFLPIAPPFY
jgi:hypothetical protein